MTTESSDTSKQPAKPLLGIRLRLMLLARLAVVPLTLDRVRVLEAGRSERIDRAAAEMMELARRGAEQQNEMVVTVRALIQAAALLCDRVGTTRQPMHGAAFVKDIPWVSSLSVVGADGRIGCSTEPRAVGLDVGDRSYLRQALSSGHFVMSDYMVGRATGFSLVMASYATTSRDMQNVATIAAMNLQWMGGFAGIVSRRPGIMVDLIDAKGTVLAHYPQSEIAAGQEKNDHPLVAAMLSRPEGYVTAEGFDGTRRVYAYVSLPWTSARLAAGLSEAEILKRIDRLILIAYAQLAFFGLWPCSRPGLPAKN